MQPFTKANTGYYIPPPTKWPNDSGLTELCYEFMESGINWGITIDEYIEKLELLMKTAELDKTCLSIPKINETYHSIDIVHPDITEKDDGRIIKLVLKFKIVNDWVVLLKEKAKGDSLIASYLVHLEKNLEYDQGDHQDAYEAYKSLLPSDNIPEIPNEFETELNQLSQLPDNKFIKGVPMKVIVDHFKVLTKHKNNKGEQILTIEQLISFLKRGFLKDEDEPIQTLNTTKGMKGAVIEVFYRFFERMVNDYNVPDIKDSFIKHFLYCFNNWDESSVKSYFKPGKITKPLK